MIFALCDAETTGLPKSRALPLDKQPRVVELGVILYDARAGKIVDEYNQVINPGILMDDEVIKIHGITNEDVAMMPPFAEAWKEAERFFLPPSAFFVAHNAPFDKQLLQWEFDRMAIDFQLPETICSAQEHYHLFGKRPKLVELYKLATGKNYEHKHRAIDDTRVLLEALIALKFFEAFLAEEPKVVEPLKPGTYDIQEEAAPAPAPTAPPTAELHITRPA